MLHNVIKVIKMQYLFNYLIENIIFFLITPSVLQILTKILIEI